MQTSGTNREFLGIWGLDGKNIWAVGQEGVITKWDGASWTLKSSGPLQDLQGLWGAGANNIWASGASGTIAHRSLGHGRQQCLGGRREQNHREVERDRLGDAAKRDDSA